MFGVNRKEPTTNWVMSGADRVNFINKEITNRLLLTCLSPMAGSRSSTVDSTLACGPCGQVLKAMEVGIPFFFKIDIGY